MEEKHLFEGRIRELFGKNGTEDVVQEYHEDSYLHLVSFVLKLAPGKPLPLPGQLDKMVELLDNGRDFLVRFAVAHIAYDMAANAELEVHLEACEGSRKGEVVLKRHFPTSVRMNLEEVMRQVTHTVGHRNVTARFVTQASAVYMMVSTHVSRERYEADGVIDETSG